MTCDFYKIYAVIKKAPIAKWCNCNVSHIITVFMGIGESMTMGKEVCLAPLCTFSSFVFAGKTDRSQVLANGSLAAFTPATLKYHELLPFRVSIESFFFSHHFEYFLYLRNIWLRDVSLFCMNDVSLFNHNSSVSYTVCFQTTHFKYSLKQIKCTFN